MREMPLSPTYKTFVKHIINGKSDMDFLEGTTSAGKTTVGAIAFMWRVYKSKSEKASVISGLDVGTVEKNIINADYGLLDFFGGCLEYKGMGTAENRMPHLLFKTPTGIKTVYILGYGDQARWKKALGSQFYALYIDEVNVANIEYVREATMRADYVMTTSNPDNPDLPIYKEYINHSRPLPQFEGKAPAELRAMLNEPPKERWTWWFFDFNDNAGLSEKKKQQIINAVPPNTKIYKNKILGLRGKATGLVFSNFDRQRHIVTPAQAHQEQFVKFSAGLDTAYSSKSPDTIAMSFIGITANNKCVVLDERVYNNAELSTPIAPSDTVVNYIAFLDRCRENWGDFRDVFIDSADQATITEFAKYKRLNGSIYNFNPAWKKTKVADRIQAQLGWFAKDQMQVVDTCQTYIKELSVYSWLEDKDLVPEDSNDHMVNSVQYAFLPYITKIGGME